MFTVWSALVIIVGLFVVVMWIIKSIGVEVQKIRKDIELNGNIPTWSQIGKMFFLLSLRLALLVSLFLTGEFVIYTFANQ